MRKLWFAIPVFITQTALAAPLQSQAQWEAAIRNNSTSSYYVLVTIVDDRTGQSQTGCTEANFVQGALYREQKLPKQMASFAKVKQQMLDSRDHVFHFSDPGALANVAFRYTPEELQQARAAEQAMQKNGKPEPSEMRHSDAFACALVEQGYRVSNADVTGMILWNR